MYLIIRNFSNFVILFLKKISINYQIFQIFHFYLKKVKDVRQYLDNPVYSKNAMRLRTSGSTGKPFEVAVSDNAWIIEQDKVWRHWAWGGYKFRDKLTMVRSYAPKPGEQFYKHYKLRNFYLFSPFN